MSTARKSSARTAIAKPAAKSDKASAQVPARVKTQAAALAPVPKPGKKAGSTGKTASGASPKSRAAAAAPSSTPAPSPKPVKSAKPAIPASPSQSRQGPSGAVKTAKSASKNTKNTEKSKPETQTQVPAAAAKTSAQAGKSAGKAASPGLATRAGATMAPDRRSPGTDQAQSPTVKQATAPVAAADMPTRQTRPSARLAALTVPSMPPAVASTAAKSSYLKTMPAIAPPAPAAPSRKDPKLANHWKTLPLEKLTDADILSMPDSEYMNSVQMAYFRRKLVQLKQDILNNAGETTEHLREETVVVPDPADRATIEEEHALELRTRDRERKLLKKIEQSIARIDAEDYGYCDETGEPIGVGRLLARPTATLSLEAQQRRELKQKMFGD